jgi:metal-responsive CopG/Arc/MetJ family transcriptional regulator
MASHQERWRLRVNISLQRKELADLDRLAEMNGRRWGSWRSGGKGNRSHTIVELVRAELKRREKEEQEQAAIAEANKTRQAEEQRTARQLERLKTLNKGHPIKPHKITTTVKHIAKPKKKRGLIKTTAT